MPLIIPHIALRAKTIASQPLALVLAITAVLYAVGLAVMPPEALTHHDTGAKYLQVRNLRLTPSGLDYSVNYPARPLDPQLLFVPFRDKQYYIDTKGEQGRIYLQWPIFLGLLTRIPWKLFGFWGLYIVPFLAGLAGCWATFRLALALDVPKRLAWIAAPLVGLATPLSLYAMLFFENTLAAMLVTLSLLFAARSAQVATPSGEPISRPPGSRLQQLIRRVPASVWCGIFLAVSVYFRSELYVLAAVMGFVFLLLAVRFQPWRKTFFLWLVAFLAALVPLWLFYVITEGTLLPLHATWYFAGASSVGEAAPSGGLTLPALRYIVRAGWGVVPDFLLGPQTFPLSPVFPTGVGIMGVGGTILCVVAGLGRGLARKWTSTGQKWQIPIFMLGLFFVGAASLYIAVMPQPYRNLHGFLVASPFIALALWPPSKVFHSSGITKHGILYVVTLLWVVAHTIIISALSGLGPISRGEWGQRYLLSAYPALIVLGMLGVLNLLGELQGDRVSATAPPNRAARTLQPYFAPLAALLALIGLLFSLRGYGALYDERTQVHDWLALARTMPAQEPLVTDEWWLPLNLAADFYTRPIMLAEGDTELTQWAAQMRAHGVTTFGFMTDKPATFTSAWASSTAGLQPVGAPVEVRGIWLQQYMLGP